jgi:hypothetical protein
VPVATTEEHIPAPKFHRTFDPKTFKATFADLSGMVTDLTEGAPSIASTLGRTDHDHLTSLLNAADQAYLANYREEAWYYLARAALKIGNFQATEDRAFRSSEGVAVDVRLREFASKGGQKSGDKFASLRDRAAKAIITKAPAGGWPTKTAFELAYHPIVAKILGEHDTDHQRKMLLRREDVRAVLPRSMIRKKR